MATLYELTEDFQNIIDVLESDATDSEMKELLTSALEQTKCNIKDKVDNIVRVIKNYDADIEALKNEEKRLADRRKNTEKQRDNLVKHITEFTKECEGKKLKGNVFELAIKKNPAKLVIEDEKIVPFDFITEETIYKIDKRSLKEHVKHNPVEGIYLIQEESLRIK